MAVQPDRVTSDRATSCCIRGKWWGKRCDLSDCNRYWETQEESEESVCVQRLHVWTSIILDLARTQRLPKIFRTFFKSWRLRFALTCHSSDLLWGDYECVWVCVCLRRSEKYTWTGDLGEYSIRLIPNPHPSMHLLKPLSSRRPEWWNVRTMVQAALALTHDPTGATGQYDGVQMCVCIYLCVCGHFNFF